MSTPTPTPKQSPESIVRDVESAPDALQHLRDQLESQDMNARELRELREAMEKSGVKQKREVLEEIEKKMRVKEAEEALAGYDTNVDKDMPALPRTISPQPKGGLVDTVGNVVNDYSIKASELVLGDRTKDWSDQKKRNVGLAITVGTIAVVGTIAWLLMRGKASAEAGKEAAEKSDGGFFKKLLISLGIGAAAFLGYKGYQMYGQYKEKMQTLENLQTQLKEARDAASMTEGKIRDEWKEKERELAEQIEEAKKRMKEGSEENKNKPEVERALDIARSRALIMTAAGLVLTHKKLAVDAGIIRENENETEKVAEMLMLPEVRELPIEQLLPIKTAEQAAALVPELDLTQSQKNALLFLSLVTQDTWKSKRVRTFVSGKGEEADPKTTQLKQLLDMTSVIPNFFGEVGSALEGKNFKQMLDIRNVLEKSLGPDSMLHQFVDHPIIREKLCQLEPELKDKEAQFAVFCLMQKDKLTLKSIIETEPRNEEEKIFLRALTKIRNELLLPESQNYLQLYAHGDENYKNILTRQLSGDLNVQDAAQLYAYLQLAKDPKKEGQFPATLKESPGTAAMLLQMKVLNIVSKVNKGEGIRMRDMLILRSTKADFDIPDEMRDMIAKLSTIGADVVSNQFWIWLKEGSREVGTFITEAHRIQPEISFTTDAVLTGGLAYTIRAWMKRNHFKQVADALHEQKWGRKILSWVHPTEAGKHYYSISKTTSLSTKMYDLEARIQTLADPKFQGQLMKSFKDLHRRGYLPSSFEKFYKEASALKAAGADAAVVDDVVREMQVLQSDWRILQRHRFLFARRWTKSIVETGRDLSKVAGSIKNSAFMEEVAKRAGTTAEAVMDVVSKVPMPQWFAEALAKSKGGMQMLINAVKSGGAPAVEYLVKLSSFVKVSGKVLGGAAVGIDVLICAIEMAANKVRIEQTDNPAIKDLYAMRDKMSIANATVGTAFGGAMFVSTWAPAAAPVAVWLALPLAGVIATKHAHDQLEAVSETWLSEEKDWAKKSSGDLMHKLQELGPGNVSFWQNVATGNSRVENISRWMTVSEQDFKEWQKQAIESPEKANEGQRFLVTRALVAKMTDIEPMPGESDQEFKERFAQFQRLQISYIADVTEGKFGSNLMLVYRNAQTHAELATLSQRLKEAGTSQMLTIEKSDEHGNLVEKEFDLATYGDFRNQRDRNSDGISPLDVIVAYQRQQQAVAMIQLSALKEMGGSGNETVHIQDALLQRSMLLDVRYDLANCERKMQETDFSGWSWTGGEEKSRTLARYVMNVEFRKLLRAESDRLQSKGDASPQDLAESMNRLRAFLQQDPLAFEKMAHSADYSGASEFAANSSVLTDHRWTEANLYLRPAPRSSSAREAA